MNGELPNWREWYRAAILELDPSQLPKRIAEAEGVVIARARELFQDGGSNAEETEDLDDALYALRALRSALKYSPSAVDIIGKPDLKVA